MSVEFKEQKEENSIKCNCFVTSFEIPFKTTREATFAYNSLRIDKEPARGGVSKELNVHKNFLKVKMSSDDVKKLRASVNSFFDLLILVVSTIEQFG